MAKNNNKQKPPNTLLSSQTTHPLSRQPYQRTPSVRRRQSPSASLSAGAVGTRPSLRAGSPLLQIGSKRVQHRAY
jgi:hypothetical protein